MKLLFKTWKTTALLWCQSGGNMNLDQNSICLKNMRLKICQIWLILYRNLVSTFWEVFLHSDCFDYSSLYPNLNSICINYILFPGFNYSLLTMCVKNWGLIVLAVINHYRMFGNKKCHVKNFISLNKCITCNSKLFHKFCCCSTFMNIFYI